MQRGLSTLWRLTRHTRRMRIDSQLRLRTVDCCALVPSWPKSGACYGHRIFGHQTAAMSARESDWLKFGPIRTALPYTRVARRTSWFDHPGCAWRPGILVGLHAPIAPSIHESATPRLWPPQALVRARSSVAPGSADSFRQHRIRETWRCPPAKLKTNQACHA